MSGTLGNIALLPPEDLETGVKRLDVYNDAIQSVLQRGLTLPTMPQEFTGELPANITSLHDQQLGDLLAQLSSYCSYVETELAKAEVIRDAAENQLEFVQARVRIGLKAQGQKLTVDERKDIMTVDPRVVEARNRALFAEAVYRITRTLKDKAQRNWETVSRRITQRGQEVDRMRRDMQVSGMQAGANTRRFAR